MARAYGSRIQMMGAFESVYGTPPATGFRLLPFASHSLGSEQPLLELIGFGRDPLVPTRDAITDRGGISVPIDVENIGFWLRGLFGAPTTTGTTPKTHTFTSGGFSLPSMALEFGYPEVPHYAMNAGCVVDRMRWKMARSGLLRTDIELVAQGETTAATSSAASSPATPYNLTRFGHFNGSITRDAVALGNIVEAEVDYSNNLSAVETIRSDGKIDGVDPTVASLKMRIKARFADTTLLTQAISGAASTLAFAYTISANASFTFTAHAVYLPRPKFSVDGPGAIEAEFEAVAALATSPARMCTAVLVNTVASY